MEDDELLRDKGCEALSGGAIKASTWRYWDMKGTGPQSFKLGKSRVWRKSVVLQWIADQEAAAAAERAA